jgi:hypothetical protein
MQVISMKLECNPELFVEDPEGLALAERINAFLPPEVSVMLRCAMLCCLLPAPEVPLGLEWS